MMRGGNISVRIQIFEYPSDADVFFSLPIDESMVRRGWREIDFPTLDAGISEIFCTPNTIRETVEIDREKIAVYVCDAIKDHLMKSMESNDTIMGFIREQERE